MVLAAYQVAARLGAPFVYLQSEGRREQLHRYRFTQGGQIAADPPIQIPAMITLDDYLRAYIGPYQVEDEAKRRKDSLGLAFERAIAEALAGVVDEVERGVRIGGALELDLVVRRGNRVGVIEAKTGRKAGTKEVLDQLNAACGRERLGIYTAKILVINQRWDETRENLRELAEAWGIWVVELPSFQENSPSLSRGDQERPQEKVRKALRGS
ncbi:MAG: hypothetical protein NZM16_13995 [Thermoflexus sp.]|uniref:hypothetical protein n=1 Tax=Thermoflexus sp. TaxID=1969742 RepID=UPI0025E6294A|nr:hypothetical protein [Thermoflexus sp.]MCS6965135.1 hypothetical protein [Thermoflexus sp.]MDW8184645.1 hypothetical protein [Anaerolineae bacterium]